MALTASSSEGSYEVVPEGTHRAVCYKIVDSGTREEQYKEEDPKKRHSIFIYWELTELPMDDGRPFSINKQYTLSLNENSNLHKDLKTWRGKSFTAEELKGFDLTNILGVSCDVEVAHNQNGRAVVASIFKPDGGAKKSTTKNEQVVFDLEEYVKEFSGDSCKASKAMCDVFEDLPPFMQEMIQNSFEYKGAERKGLAKQQSSSSSSEGLASVAKKKKDEEVVDDFIDDDIPF
jgi:hypothetical protein|tara:strand:+ start:211 stop:909 length:699 start_codon:yes stop_codon:yes gene_type:complete